MKLDTIVILKDGRKGIITYGQYQGTYGVSNHWGGKILDENGNLTEEGFNGNDNGRDWIKYDGEYTIEKRVVFKKKIKNINTSRQFL